MRYEVTDGSREFKNFREDFNILDTWTEESWDVHFAWVGKDMKKTGTWDYAPLCEMVEIESKEYNEYRLRLHQDEEFIEQQITMLRRYYIWWEQHKTEIITKDELRAHFDNDLMVCQDVDGTKYLFSGNPLDIEIQNSYPAWIINKRLFELLRQYKKSGKILSRILWKLQINLSAEEKEIWKAHKRSEKLIKQWLTEDELRWLIHQGELRIENGDETFVIKKDHRERVEVIGKDKKLTRYCLIPKESSAPAGDVLLTKILMIKTNPKKFKEIAIASR